MTSQTTVNASDNFGKRLLTPPTIQKKDIKIYPSSLMLEIYKCLKKRNTKHFVFISDKNFTYLRIM